MIDDRGALIYGNADAGTISGRLTFPMLFYPAEEIQARMSGGGVCRGRGRSRSARLTLAGAMSGFSRSYWPTLCQWR